MSRRRALLVAFLVSATALAGCAGDAPEERAGEPIRPGTTGSGSPSTGATPTAEPVRPRGTSERWHFHDHWRGNPTITLFEGDVTLNVTTGSDGLPAVGAIVSLPHGTIVPPETGFLTINATWETDTMGGLNFTYKPADSNDYFPIGDVMNGVPFELPTTESNCDVPHRQESLWRFNFSARPSMPPTGLPPKEFHLVIQATIGRPLFIDPPHLDWWRAGDTIPLVTDASGELRSARTPVANLTAPGVPSGAEPPSAAALQSLGDTHRVPVDSGRIVPEGARSIVAMLNWTSRPDAKLALHYFESNYPSTGPMEIAVDGEGSRTYVLKVAQAQTDTTYSNRTTWEFRVVPEGEPAAAFDGSFTLVAWASRLQPAEALAEVSGG